MKELIGPASIFLFAASFYRDDHRSTHSKPHRPRIIIMRLHSLKIAFATVATMVASAGAFASPYDGCQTIAQGIQRCWSPSQVSRDDVKAELKKSRNAGELQVVGELSGAPVARAEEPATALTRDEVRDELRQAQREGQLQQVGDLGRTQAEVSPQRYASNASDAKPKVVNSR
jgi:hypothetical protein